MTAVPKAISDAEVPPALRHAETHGESYPRLGSKSTGTMGGHDEQGPDADQLLEVWERANAGQEWTQADRVRFTEQLVEIYHEAVYRYAFWLTGCRTAAEDVTQEVFARAFRAIQNLRDISAVKSWLLTITRNESTRTGRKKRPLPVGEIPESGSLLDEHGQVEAEQCEWVKLGLAELSDEYRTVVLMFYYEQLSYTEIAEKLSIPIGTVMSRLNRGRTNLRNALNRLAEPNLRPGAIHPAAGKMQKGNSAIENTETQSDR